MYIPNLLGSKVETELLIVLQRIGQNTTIMKYQS